MDLKKTKRTGGRHQSNYEKSTVPRPFMAGIRPYSRAYIRKSRPYKEERTCPLATPSIKQQKDSQSVICHQLIGNGRNIAFIRGAV